MALKDSFMLPAHVMDILEISDLLDAEQIEINRLKEMVLAVQRELNITTTDKLLPRYRDIFCIADAGSKSEQIKKVLAKLNTMGVTNKHTIVEIAKIVTGKTASVLERFNEYYFDVSIPLLETDDIDTFGILCGEIEEVKPAHLAYTLNYIIAKALEIRASYRHFYFDYLLCNTFKAGERHL